MVSGRQATKASLPEISPALELLEHAYAGKVVFQSLAFADQWSSDTVGTDPLNWSLTPLLRKVVHASADRSEMKTLYQIAAKWLNASPTAWSKDPARDGGPQENSAK